MKLKEDWLGGRYCTGYWMENRDVKMENRKKFIEQNLKIINEYPESIKKAKEGLKDLKGKVTKEDIKNFEDSIRYQEMHLELSKKLLSITEKIHFYTPTSVEVDCQGSVSKKTVSKDSDGKTWTTTMDIQLVGDHYSVKEYPGTIPHPSRRKYDEEKIRKEGISTNVYKWGNYARPTFTFMLSSVTKKEWDGLIGMVKEIRSNPGNIFPLSWQDGICWSRDYLKENEKKEWWHVHTFPEKQEGYSATLRAMLAYTNAMVRKNGEWKGVRRFSSGEKKALNFKIASSGAIFNNVYSMPVYPLFDYYPSYIHEVNSTPAFGHYRNHPEYSEEEKAYYHSWGGTLSDHYYWMESKKNGINFDTSFRLRGLDNKKKDGRESRKDAVLDVDVLINPLPEGDL